MRSLNTFGISVLMVVVSILMLSHCRRQAETANIMEGSDQVTGLPEYAGRESCKRCHEKEYNLFTGSDHDQAMDTAMEGTVLGNFDNVSLTHFGVTSRFYRRDGKFFVETEGPEGKMEEFEVRYTFGIRPLQQYLIEFPGGALQCLPLCWDTRPAEDGGQRWFHIYHDERIPPGDLLFWTRITQNWNYMCAECHSTNLRKNFDYTTETYHTTWSEIDVSCEACHGPGSRHIDWAELVEQGRQPGIYPDMGLTVRVKDTDNATWVFDPDSVTARRSVPRHNNLLVEMCSRCHARRSTISENYFHGKSFLDTHWPSLLDEDLYFPDGQIRDEVYVYASFLQSKMFRAGVVCKDCHEPHSGKVFVLGNALCYRCHMAEKYGGREHHFHDPAREGASCFECHMPERTYMVIDPRRDHSIRVPRPDLSEKLGTPNACNKCHNDKSNQWAAEYLEEWYGKVLPGKEHYGEVFWAGRQQYPEAHEALRRISLDTAASAIVRATAVSLLGNYPGPETVNVLTNTVKDSDPLIRFATLSIIQIAGEDAIIDLALPLLQDSVKLVRMLSALALTHVPTQYLPRTSLKRWNNALGEYKDALMINADHPSTHVNLGNLYLNLGDFENAETSYKKAIEIEPGIMVSYINLADLYRRLNREEEGEQLLRNALDLHPELSAVQYALGLLLVRKNQNEEAMVHLKQAALLEPENPHYSYVYGIGLNSYGKPEEAVSFLETALSRHPYDRNILYSLSTINHEQGRTVKALEYAKRLIENYPDDPNYRQLNVFLQSQ
ncbi:MAG: tetratricopeptide repeat protein [Bacteroidales bacterium]|nr:MAG: tetratricopeptide repeat protein [Bacteroidales bacterium]